MIEIKVNPCSEKNIQQAIDDLKAYKKKLIERSKLVIDVIAQRFDEILSEQAPIQGLWTYETADSERGYSVVFKFKGETEFIEFGTGIVGKENHDGANMEWAEKLPPPYTGYESGHMINPITHTWRYWENGRWVVTKGQIANPFIYRSVQQLMEESAEIVRKVING